MLFQATKFQEWLEKLIQANKVFTYNQLTTIFSYILFTFSEKNQELTTQVQKINFYLTCFSQNNNILYFPYFGC